MRDITVLRKDSLRALALAGLIGVLAFVGCKDSKLACYPVNGSVNVDSKPTEGVMVIFCPVGGSPELQKTRPFGITDAEGKFQLTSFNKGDGCPLGQYKVLMQWSGKPAKADGRMQTAPDRLQNRYMNLDKTQFNVDVKAQTNDIPPFELKSK